LKAPWRIHCPANALRDFTPLALTVPALLIQQAQAHRDRLAYECLGARLSFGDTLERANAFASWLQDSGLVKGDRVAIMLPNLLSFPIAAFGVFLAGGVCVTINPLYTAREVRNQLQDSGATTIVVLENFASVVEAAIQDLPIARVVICAVGDLMPRAKGLVTNFAVRHIRKAVPRHGLKAFESFSATLDRGRRHPPTAVPVSSDDIAFLQYTGGTTGMSKGATLLQRNILWNVEQAAVWQSDLFEEASPEVLLTPLPLYHIYSLTMACLMGLRIGMGLLLVPNPRDINGLVTLMRKRRFTAMAGINTLYAALLAHPRFDSIDWSAVKLCGSGGAAMQRAVAERWQQRTGRPIIEGYGLSETSPVVSYGALAEASFTGHVGPPLPGTDVSIRDETGREVALGESGEICVRGPQVMAGYFEKPDETIRVITDDGYFKTGDIGTMDQLGLLRIVDRKKDLILVSGFDVYLNEIEDVVATMEGIAECAVIGVPDEHSGEAAKLFVVRQNADIEAETIIAFCRKHLAAYKVPKQIEFRDSSPKSAVGKVLRRELRAPPEPGMRGTVVTPSARTGLR
jgi:long-chain acyl-CoA synthetase